MFPTIDKKSEKIIAKISLENKNAYDFNYPFSKESHFATE